MPKSEEIQPREVIITRSPKSLRVKVMASDNGFIDVQSVEANLLYEILAEIREQNVLIRRLIDVSSTI